MKELMDFRNKIVLVTGSARGIGYAVAEGFAGQGAHVIINATTQQNAERAAAKIRASGGMASACGFNLLNQAEIRQAIDHIENEIGAIDVLVNNAGTSPSANSFFDVEESDWNRVVEVNQNALFRVTQAVSRYMVKRRKGKIINITSMAGLLALRGKVAYSASKAAANMITKNAGAELGGFNIQVNAIAPGYIKTDMTDAFFNDEKAVALLKSRTPSVRFGEVGDIRNAALFLASPMADFINGHVLSVDGGMSVII